MAGLRRRRAAEPREHERRHRHADEAEDRARVPARRRSTTPATAAASDRERHRPPAGGRVSGGAPEVARDGPRPPELLAAAADADVEPVGEDEVGEPERDPEHEHRQLRRRSPLGAGAAADTRTYAAWPPSNEHAVRVGRHDEQRREHPQRPSTPTAALQSLEQGERARERAEQEEAVHPAVDPVEEEQPARGDERRRDERDPRSREPPAEHRDERKARERERGGREPQPAEAEPEVGDGPRDEEVERRAAPVARDVLDDAGERVAADEERERLVLVRGPRHQLVEQERGRGERHAGDSDPQRVLFDPRAQRRTASCRPAPPRPSPRSLASWGFRHLRW